MPDVIAGSRARLTVAWRREDELVDPLQILFSMWFTPNTKGLPMEQTSYEYTVDSEVVRKSVGQYYVEVLLPTAGKLKYTWRSVSPGEEVNVEYTVDVVARSGLERA
jgi:hypothetical protein